MSDMNAIKKQARVAGLWYLVLAITAPVGLMIVPDKIIVSKDAAATADHIRASEWLLRIGIGSELFHQVICVFLVLALYRLFKPISKTHARQLVILGALVSVPIVFLNVLNEVAALVLVSGADFLSVFDKRQLDALAYLFLRLHGQGIIIASIFWGLWLFPFGTLVVRSGFIPRLLGILLFLAGVGYLVVSFNTLVLPQLPRVVGQLAGVLELGELPIIFWLLIWGAKDQSSGGQTVPTSGGLSSSR
jgi:hypothetical protein